MPQKILIAWTFPQYTNPDRKKGWYIWATIIFVLLLLYSIFTANFLFGLIIIMVAILMFVYYYKQVEEVKFSITNQGVEINNQSYNFKDFKNFWLIYEPPAVKNLYFEPKSLFKPTLVIPLQNQNPVVVRKILKEQLEEDLNKEGESTVEALERVLKI